MDKFAFNHDGENLAIALGIGDERADQIIKICRIAHINGKSNLDMFEETINEVDPKNYVEAVFAGYCIAKVLEVSGSSMGSVLAKMMGL